MPVYVWKGKNSYGEKRKGEIEAPDQTAALAQVKRLRITDPVIKEKPKDLFANISIFQPKPKRYNFTLHLNMILIRYHKIQ